jgi:hypothetical protein
MDRLRVPRFPACVQGIRPPPTVAAGRYPRAVDPSRAQRLLSLAETALAQADATRRAVEALLTEVGPRRPAPAPDTRLDAARLVAIEMAVAGRSRQEVGAHVRESYELGDVEALLDDVFGPAVPAA